ncbi:hypothetical protein ABT009_45010 [Streptomyces sp. NPDC002896]|uniref:hypothetical protein n=1 Tax=Streptomyces sp. NPDC002896 TaxID=3154438 RepID=UPI003329A558
MTTRPPSPDDLRAVLFDSGGVLMRPIGGRWNPRADFEQTVLTYDPAITPEQFAAAIDAGERFFTASSSTPDYDDYHRVLLRDLGVDPIPQLLADLRREVPPATVLETYPEVVGTLEELSRRGVRPGPVCPPSTRDWASGSSSRRTRSPPSSAAVSRTRACTTTPAPP